MEFKDYYATLGVGKNATDKELKQAYRKLARKLHPDVNPGDKAAENKFKALTEAYEVLGDPEKRRKYDELGANWRQYEQAQQQGGASSPGGPWSPPGGGGFRTMSEEDMREMFGNENPFSDFFNQFFGGPPPGQTRARGERAGRSRKGRDIEHDIELTLEEAFRGATRHLSIKHEGHSRTVDVRIPPGVGEGSKVRVPGEGGHGSSAGDLYLRIHLLPNARFERKARDLSTRVGIPLTVAVLGGEAEVPGIDGRVLRLKVPATTQNAQVFRLKGHGMPAPGKADDRGDLYVTVEVRIPRQVSEEQKRLYEELARLESAGPSKDSSS
jgi:curved DNA-binding protein